MKTFLLNVGYDQENGYCVFTLSKNDGQLICSPASIRYSETLQRCYQTWLQQYKRHYQFPSSQAISNRDNSGNIDDIPSGDSRQDLQDAEERLLKVFKIWLSEVREIENRIRYAVTIVTHNQNGSSSYGIDIFLKCDANLMKFPWEAWAESLSPEELPRDTIRLIRTSIDTSNGIVKSTINQRLKKPRILTILGYDPKLNERDEWIKWQQQNEKIVKSLKSVADVITVNCWEYEDSQVIDKVIAEIIDDRGCDVLIFIGHSNNEGRFYLTPNSVLTVSVIQEKIEQAYGNRLQLAIFISCCGGNIAQSLTNLGLQVVCMRERIYTQKAQRFLRLFCQQFGQRKNVQESLIIANQQLYSERIDSPSVYLLSSFHSPLGAAPFQLKPFGIKHKLKRWLPEKRELIGVGSILLINSLIPIQELLLDFRYVAQDIYRNLTNQIHQLDESQFSFVYLISIDQESVEWANDKYNDFKTSPMDREFLADLVNKLTELEVKTIGINYDLYKLPKKTEKNDKLTAAINNSVDKQGTWFVIPYEEYEPSERIANPKWTLQGDSGIYIGIWKVELPELSDNLVCSKPCPFAYLLALSHRLNNDPQWKVQPNLNSNKNFQQQLNNELKNSNLKNELSTLKKANNFFGINPIVDFSIPSEISVRLRKTDTFPKNPVYKAISAKNLITGAINSSEFQGIEQGIVIITNGVFDDAEDTISLPLVTQVRCLFKKNCPEYLMKGEVYAYHINHINSFLSPQSETSIPPPRLVPNLLMIGTTIILGKFVTLFLFDQEKERRIRLIYVLIIATGVYGIICLQAYLPPINLVFSFLFPVLIFWFYLIPTIRRLNHDQNF